MFVEEGETGEFSKMAFLDSLLSEVGKKPG